MATEKGQTQIGADSTDTNELLLRRKELLLKQEELLLKQGKLQQKTNELYEQNNQLLQCQITILPNNIPEAEDNTDEEVDSEKPVHKTFQESLDALQIPAQVEGYRGKELFDNLVAKLDALKKILIESGENEKNNLIIVQTEQLIEKALAPIKFREDAKVGETVFEVQPFDYKGPIRDYREKVSNLSINQSVVIAVSAFLGALVGFLVGAVVGAAVTGANPFGIFAGFSAGAVIGASIGAAAGGSIAGALSCWGIFKYDPVKAKAREFVDLVEYAGKTAIKVL